MTAIVQQLGLDSSFFIQLALIAGLFAVLGPLYFKPFMRLFEARHRRTVEDRKAAEDLMAQAEAKLEEYRRLLQEERLNARREIEATIAEARKDEAKILAKAAEEAKRLTQEAQETLAKERDAVSKALEGDVEILSRTLSEKILETQG